MKSLGSARPFGVGWRRSDVRRIASAAALVFAAAMVAPRAALAHELTESDIITLGVMGEDMLSRGTLDGSDDDMVAILDLSWAYGLPDLEATPDDARQLLQFSREERERRQRYDAVMFRFGGTGVRLLRVGQRLTCDQMREKAAQARRVAGALRKVAAMYGVATVALNAGGTVVGAISARFLWPVAFGAAVAGTASIYADELAVAYQNAPCSASGGSQWKPESIRAGDALETPSSPGPSPCSRRRPSGWLPVA